MMRKLKKEYKIFEWIPKGKISGMNKIQKIYCNKGLEAYFVTHFSAAIKNDHITDIGNLIGKFLDK